jgi:hypothetical protein
VNESLVVVIIIGDSSPVVAIDIIIVIQAAVRIITFNLQVHVSARQTSLIRRS